MTQARFGERLRAIREKVGLSGYRVASDAGVDGGLYAKIETGQRHPTDDVLSKLAPVLGIPFDELKAWADADRLGQEGIERLKRFVLLDGGLDFPDDVTDPMDEWELEILTRTGAIHAPDYGPESDFPYLPKEERRALLENLDETWRENEELMKKLRRGQG